MCIKNNPVGHLTQVAGHSMITYVQDGKPVSFWIKDVMQAAIAKTIAEGDGWPVTAMYRAEYTCRTWPMGWEKEASIKYFDTREELDKWLLEQADWARCEDNEVKITVDEWDLGPTFLSNHHYR